MYAVKNNDIVIVCKRCGKELDFWKHYRDNVCEECDKYLDRRIKEINRRLEEKKKFGG